MVDVNVTLDFFSTGMIVMVGLPTFGFEIKWTDTLKSRALDRRWTPFKYGTNWRP